RYHFGFDPVGLSRALVKNAAAGEVVQGGSTVTQQLAKNLFLEPRRVWKRKVEELFIATWLETKYSKDEIMELYLNRIYFGSGCYGVGAAAYHYFGKKTEALSLAEAAFLTALIKAPSMLSSQDNRKAAQKRVGLVLQNMRDDGFITEAEYKHALAYPATIRPEKPTPPGFEYVVDWIVAMVPTLTGKTEVNLTVETSLDMELQRMMDTTVKRMMAENAKPLDVKQAALVMLSPDGGVKAMFGGMDYKKSQFNRAVKAKRQPASVFKAFVYLAAIESGLKPDSLVDLAPLEGEGWAPNKDSPHKTSGLISLKTALAKSSNTAAVRIMRHVGADKVIDAAHRLGLTSRLNVGPTLALGTAETTLLDITAAYATFANGGVKVLPYIVTRVSDDEDRALFERKRNDDKQVTSPENVALMNEMLSAVVTSGTGRNAQLPDRPAAGKTGTSSDYHDAWFIGYTADYVAGVWLGNDRHTPMKKVTGGGLPAKIWRAVMEETHWNLPPRPLPGMVAPAKP
ncbi:MAG: PBP1A family penicillin-binding protein, partial [Alphaproteobacteria bacterium]